MQSDYSLVTIKTIFINRTIPSFY